MRGRSRVNRMYTPINAATAVAGWNVAPSPRTGHESEKETQGFLCQLGTLLQCPLESPPESPILPCHLLLLEIQLATPTVAIGSRTLCCSTRIQTTAAAAAARATGKQWNAGAYGLRLGQPPLLGALCMPQRESCTKLTTNSSTKYFN